jgi:hypothetical protein
MKFAFLRFLAALIVAAIAVSSVSTDIGVQRAAAEKAKIEAAQLQKEKTASAEAEQQKREEAEKQAKIRQREEAEQEAQKKVFLLTSAGSGKILFTNKVDGYSIEIPEDMNADMSLSDVRAVLENKSLKIEIYRQELDASAGESAEQYINYSNQFINNNIDHKKEAEGIKRINGRAVYYLQWSRNALSKVPGDRNYYASADIRLSDREVITLIFKSSSPLKSTECLDVVKSLKLVNKSEEPYTQKMHRAENKTWDEATARAYEQYFGDSKGLTWGIYETNAPLDFTALNEIENNIGFRFPILIYYTAVIEYEDMHPGLVQALENAKRENRLLELTLQTVAQTPGKGNMVYDILDGKYDTYLKNYARAVADSEAPVLFRLGNEMNGDWCVYSCHHTSKDTDVFKAFYHYIYQIFEAEGADNVIWVWNPNGKSFPDFKWNDEVCYYPGDDFVDVVGMTSYNTGTYYEGEKWVEFDEMYTPIYERDTARFEQPLMITEFSCSSVGGIKEEWVSDMFKSIDDYDRIKVAVWWDGCDWDAEGNIARSYFIDETDGLVRIFKENLAKYKQPSM